MAYGTQCTRGRMPGTAGGRGGGGAQRLSRCAGWYLGVYSLVWVSGEKLPATTRETQFWEAKVGPSLLTSRASAPWRLSRRCRHAHASHPVIPMTAKFGGRCWGGMGGGGGWHDASLCCCLQLAAPVGLSPLTLAVSLNPVPPHHPQAAAPISLSPPCALPLPAWPTLTSPLTLPSLGRLCQRSPWTVPVSLLCVGSTRRRARRPVPAVGDPSPTAAFGPQDVHLWGRFPNVGGLDPGGNPAPSNFSNQAVAWRTLLRTVKWQIQP